MLTGDTQVSIVSSFINILMSYIINTSSKLVICNPQVCIKPTQATWSLFYKPSTVLLWLSNCNVVTRAYYKRTSDCNRASDKTLQVCFESKYASLSGGAHFALKTTLWSSIQKQTLRKASYISSAYLHNHSYSQHGDNVIKQQRQTDSVYTIRNSVMSVTHRFSSFHAD